MLQGFRIPALTTRRADTEIELRNNQTFAIAGLLNNSVTQSLQKVAGIGDIPVLGLLFKSKAAQKDQTELVVMITPEILPAGSPGVTRELPRMIEPNLPPVSGKKTFPAPAPAFSPGSGTLNAVPSSTPTANASAGSQAPQVQGTTAAPAPPAAHEPTKAERKTMERAAQEQHEREQADLATKATLDKRNAKQSDEQAKRDKQLAEEQARKDRAAAEEQAKKDREAATEQARKDRQAAEVQGRKDREAHEQAEKAAREQVKRDAEQAKRDAEGAKRQAEIDRQRQKQIDEAAAKLKAAEDAYQAELAKRGQTAAQPQ